MKDNFSKQASTYAKFRPGYPPQLIHDLVSLASKHEIAWDCGTGNGQIAAMLSPYFQQVFATDISEKQLSNAVLKPNITYAVGAAEMTKFPNHCFDLITVGQAVHWFDFEKFNQEVKRVGGQHGIIALVGYALFKTYSPIDEVISHFYENIIGPYWDKERRHIDNKYASIPFPFEEINMPPYTMEYEWDFAAMTGYLRTWSAVQHYMAANGHDPVHLIENNLKKYWGENETVKIYIEIIKRVGKIA